MDSFFTSKSTAEFMAGLYIIPQGKNSVSILDTGAGSGILSCAQENPKKYDIVIGNPPYMKIPKDAPETAAMPEVCYGAPNMYFLFASMGLFNLKEDGEMVYIIPRSWTSGAYFKKFRQYFLSEGKLQQIHLFVSRNKVFDKEDVLQETIIVKVKKNKKRPDTVEITSSYSSDDFENITSLEVPYELVVSGNDSYVYLVTWVGSGNVRMSGIWFVCIV